MKEKNRKSDLENTNEIIEREYLTQKIQKFYWKRN